jgi:hypothetical protein
MALKSRRTWKNWARSMIALFVATLLMVIRPGACPGLAVADDSE